MQDLIEWLENVIFVNSPNYCNSLSFRKSLQYIKEHDIDLYKKLLQTELKEINYGNYDRQ
jgi:hypothetical protein